MNIQPSMSLSNVSANGKNSSITTNIFDKLGSATTEASTLQAGVEIAYQTLKCDRVIVYSIQPSSRCKITAEAVTPGYAEILGRTIQDHCFEEGYIEKYQKGRVRLINDVRNSGMSPCHIDKLEEIDVKSNLVVPLIGHNKSLYGLLVMHQCSTARRWQQTEIKFALDVANWMMNQISLHQTCIKFRNKIQSERHFQQLMTGIIQEIYGAATPEAVLQLAVDKAQEMLNCDRVVVYCLQVGSMGEIVAEAKVPALASILANTIEDPCFEYRYLDRYQQGRIKATSNIHKAGMTPCYVDNLAKIGVKANLVVPINRDNGEIYGLLVAHQCFDFKDWQKNEIECLKQIAIHAGLSLSKAKLKQESALVESGLTQLNKVRDTIDEVKAQIKQIDNPIKNTSQILVELINLNKLLQREIAQINENASPQTRKNTKLVQIIVSKLEVISSKLRQSLVKVNDSKNEAKAILDRAMLNLDGGESRDN